MRESFIVGRKFDVEEGGCVLNLLLWNWERTNVTLDWLGCAELKCCSRDSAQITAIED